jgi:hypothetical protein
MQRNTEKEKEAQREGQDFPKTPSPSKSWAGSVDNTVLFRTLKTTGSKYFLILSIIEVFQHWKQLTGKSESAKKQLSETPSPVNVELDLSEEQEID